jgi:hypothetical protein
MCFCLIADVHSKEDCVVSGIMRTFTKSGILNPTIMKLFLTVIFVAVITLRHAAAQHTPNDSVKIATSARQDARAFKLNDDDRKKFKAENFPATSDHFKPTAAHASKPELLNDSLYVQTFRDAAFSNTVKMLTVSFRDRMLALHPHGIENRPPPRYANGVEKTAKKDARSFHLNKALFKEFTDNQFPITSDYFKPTAYNASNDSLLNDTSYVRAFRTAAFYNTLRRPAHVVRIGLIIAGSIVVGFAGFLALLIAATAHR